MEISPEVVPFTLKNAPSLIERILPVQRLSIDVYKERMAGPGQTLTALGSYWKGRKPLILNRACVLGSLLPASENTKRDLEIFELLMGMDDTSMKKRLQLGLDKSLPPNSYRDLAAKAKRPEELENTISNHIWPDVNSHLGTNAQSYTMLIEQLGIMRFGHRPKVADVFSGSGQIPFEAARLGCDVYASDINPVACMLTWGAFNIVGAKDEAHTLISKEQQSLVARVRGDIDALGFETDGQGWRGKVYLYCLEVLCPTSGWRVPVLPSRLLSQTRKAIVDLIPVAATKSYQVVVRTGVSATDLKNAEQGTITRSSRFGEAYVTHLVDGITHRNSISSIRRDADSIIDGNKQTVNSLRKWTLQDIDFNTSDVLGERLFAIQWLRDDGSIRPDLQFRSVTEDDLTRESRIREYVAANLKDWQAAGHVPDMRIEPGAPPRYQGRSLTTDRGWTHWHHLFNPRQLLVHALLNKYKTTRTALFVAGSLETSSRLCGWNPGLGKDYTTSVFYNQSLNTLYVYGARGISFLANKVAQDFARAPIFSEAVVKNHSAMDLDSGADIYITDPPYGDAVKYEEIFDFFISWLNKNPPKEFSSWIWDSRRALAIKGEDHDFKLGMVSAYKRMAELMPDNGLQIIMFTHQSGSIWADMANIVWASGLRVTAAWYVVTETDSALREGQYVKGTILLILRKRLQELDTARDELAYELAEEVKTQVDLLTGLNNGVKDLYRDENLFEDADLQMAGYAAALRVLTRYSTIDGVSMPQEAMRPRVRGQTTMVDELIAFAVNIANEYLVPDGVDRAVWEKSVGVERFYLKMLDMESRGIHVLSNYQNFAKAFKVHDYGAVMDEVKANRASLKTAAQLGNRGMTAGEEFGPTVLRSVLYAVHLLQENKVKPEDVLHQLRDLVPDYFRERERITALADYVSKKTAKARPDESSNAMVLRDLVRRERV
ncbi:DUF1156 domain-containing protein [Variovorax sp. J22P168]|uniref:anti-phage-associated DUF1156 domain-containing protein n=1 Tax=Variovorax jilinensis TaxID=3053513 RepID=UPI002575C725|nr:anti-phage-associated DUF1156 domain-containing protein [Variovorax sp. J22P168]MDM0010899.1 DUF1156 domain-containing protein [Variovorax sp. J22P168]